MVEMPKNPNFKEAIEDLVLKMPIAKFIGMRFTKIELGFVEIVIPYREELSLLKVFSSRPCGHANGYSSLQRYRNQAAFWLGIFYYRLHNKNCSPSIGRSIYRSWARCVIGQICFGREG